MQNHPVHQNRAPARTDLRQVASKIARSAFPNDRPMGFTPRELRLMVAEMIG